MTTRTEGIIRRILVIPIILETTPTTTSIRKMVTPTGGVVRNPHRVTMTAPQGKIIKGTIVVSKIPQIGAVVIPTVVSTTTINTRRNLRMRVVRLHVRPCAVPTTLGCSRVRYAHSRKHGDTNPHSGPPQEGPTSRKRQASPPGSPERPTYARTFTGDTDYNPQPQRTIQEIPRDTQVPNPLPLNPPDIVVMPVTDRIIDYELQTAAFRAQAAGSGPDPNAAHPVRPPIPRYIHDRASPIMRTRGTVCHTQCDLYSTCSGWPCCG